MSELQEMKKQNDKVLKRAKWYVYHDGSFSTSNYKNDEEAAMVNEARDAGGIVTANSGRVILNFGGVYHGAGRSHSNSMIRALDVCAKQWNVVGDLGIDTFAVQSAGSAKRNFAITCGGHVDWRENNNNPWCIATWWPNYSIDNQHQIIPWAKDIAASV